MMRTLLLAAALILPLAACDGDKQAAMPKPEEVTADTTGFYCGMLLADHPGPKGQIHLADRQQTLWFTSVRDTIAFTRMPGEARGIRAIYVNDMAKATDWEKPEPGTWIDAHKAFFVVGSQSRGGMGGQEAVPFGDGAAAQHFADAHGGRVLRLDDIPDDYVVGPPDSADAQRETDHVAN